MVNCLLRDMPVIASKPNKYLFKRKICKDLIVKRIRIPILAPNLIIIKIRCQFQLPLFMHINLRPEWCLNTERET